MWSQLYEILGIKAECLRIIYYFVLMKQSIVSFLMNTNFMKRLDYFCGFLEGSNINLNSYRTMYGFQIEPRDLNVYSRIQFYEILQILQTYQPPTSHPILQQKSSTLLFSKIIASQLQGMKYIFLMNDNTRSMYLNDLSFPK